MTSWLALCKQGEDWRVVGQAVMEEDAREYATRKDPAAQQRKENTEKPDNGVTKL